MILDIDMDYFMTLHREKQHALMFAKPIFYRLEHDILAGKMNDVTDEQKLEAFDIALASLRAIGQIQACLKNEKIAPRTTGGLNTPHEIALNAMALIQDLTDELAHINDRYERIIDGLKAEIAEGKE